MIYTLLPLEKMYNTGIANERVILFWMETGGFVACFHDLWICYETRTCAFQLDRGTVYFENITTRRDTQTMDVLNIGYDSEKHSSFGGF